jgi:methionyl-tRNA formyltransferase
MRIVLLCGDRSSEYGAALVDRLAELGEEVDSVVLVQPPRGERLRRLLGRVGVRETARRTVARARAQPRVGESGGASASATLAARVEELGIPTFETHDVNGREAIDFLRSRAPDMIVYAGANAILREDLIGIPTVGVVNAHMGALPAYRGMNVLEWSLFNGDDLCVTVHLIDSGVDTGPVLLARSVELRAGDTIETLRARATDLSAAAVAEAVRGLADATLAPHPQETHGPQYFVMHARLREIAAGRL